MLLLRTVAIAVGLLGQTAPLAAHEFWLSPEVYQIAPGEPVAVHLRVGENFKGSSYSYFPTNFSRFELGTPEALVPAEGRLGDRPALTFTPDREGLWLVVHESTDSRLTYSEWPKFERFVKRHDLGDAVAVHRERGLPQTGFVEAYRRYAKSLIGVGAAAGEDRVVGLEVEIVVETNPYLPGVEEVTVRLLDNGEPRAGAQLEVFTRTGGAPEVEPVFLRADQDGRVSVPAVSGSEVLLGFVVLRPVEGDGAAKQPVWRSLWASLTYSVP